MITQWTCSQCQKDNPTSMKFCPHCGSPNPDASSASSPSRFAGYRKVWIAAIGLWLIGCVVLAVGGGVWWVRRQPAVETATQIASPTAIGSEITPTPTPENPLPSPTQPKPTIILEATPEPTTADPDSQQPDNINANGTTGDTLALPSAPEGIILFLSSRDHEPQTEAEKQQMGGNRSMELYAMRPDGSQQTRLSDGTHTWMKQNNYSLSTFTHSHQVMLFNSYVFNLTTRQVDEEISLDLVDRKTGALISASAPYWSSNNEIVFMGSQKNDSGMAIYSADNSGREVLQLTNSPADVWGDGWPVWSPDGEWIVFLRSWNNENQDGLWLINAEGNESYRIISSDRSGTKSVGERRAFWSPDGERLAYEGSKTNAEQFLFELWTAMSDGSQQQQLTQFPPETGIWEPSWSPDGQKIAFTVENVSGQSNRGGDIYVINADGGTPQQLTTEGYYNLAPLWLPLDADEILTGGNTPLQSPPTPTPKPQPKPQSAVPANCPNPGVQILSPVEGSTFTERQVFIIGNANINRFHHWRLEYSTVKDGHTWNYLFERDYPANNDKLAMIDTSTVPNGPYGLRLTVVDETGNYPEPCEVWFTNGY